MGNERIGVAVLLACHDRVATTIKCLSRLMPQLGDGSEVFLVDDGSTDGTGDAVRRAFPQVHVIDGDGSLYWAKGMRKAWEAAAARRGDWDGYLWLNDDADLNGDAVERLVLKDNGERIVVGELEDADGGVVYGLRERGLFTGNCVFVPRKVYERLGMICGDYSHAWADYDYAMLAMRSGVEVVSAGVVGMAEGHPNRPSLKGLPFRARLRSLSDPKGWNLHDLWLYRRRNWGIARAMASCLHMFLHVVWGER